MRIALFGGSFNPIHVGHLAIADAVVEQRLADEVWLMVSPQNPLKTQQGLMSDDSRLRLAQIAIEGHSHIKVCDREFSLPKPSYTYITMRHLRQEHPEDEFLLCIGGDNWERFPHWREPEELMKHHRIIVYPRQGCTLNLPDTDRIIALDCPLVNVSSTAIRHCLESGEDITGMVPPHLINKLKEEWNQQHP